MINKNIFIIFIQLLTFCFSQSINIGSKTLEIGMNKKEALEVLKNTFGSRYEGEIILKLEEVNEPNLDKIGISIHSNDGKSVMINRKNISLDIKQIAKKL